MNKVDHLFTSLTKKKKKKEAKLLYMKKTGMGKRILGEESAKHL